MKIECLCLGTIGLIVAPWQFDDLKSSIFADVPGCRPRLKNALAKAPY